MSGSRVTWEETRRPPAPARVRFHRCHRGRRGLGQIWACVLFCFLIRGWDRIRRGPSRPETPTTRRRRSDHLVSQLSQERKAAGAAS